MIIVKQKFIQAPWTSVMIFSSFVVSFIHPSIPPSNSMALVPASLLSPGYFPRGLPWPDCFIPYIFLLICSYKTLLVLLQEWLCVIVTACFSLPTLVWPVSIEATSVLVFTPTWGSVYFLKKWHWRHPPEVISELPVDQASITSHSLT